MTLRDQVARDLTGILSGGLSEVVSYRARGPAGLTDPVDRSVSVDREVSPEGTVGDRGLAPLLVVADVSPSTPRVGDELLVDGEWRRVARVERYGVGWGLYCV